MSMSNVTGEPTSFAKVNGEAAALSMYLNSVDQALVFQHFVDMFIVKGCSQTNKMTYDITQAHRFQSGTQSLWLEAAASCPECSDA